MTNEEISRLAELKTSTDEKSRMMNVDIYISLMSTHKSTMLWIEQVIDHDEEADYDELARDQEEAQELYSDYSELLKQSMKTRDPKVLNEFLFLLKKESQEKYDAIKSPIYVPVAERTEYSADQINEIVNKREAYAKTRCVETAQIIASNLAKSTGREGK